MDMMMAGLAVALGAYPGHVEIGLSRARCVYGISYPVHDNNLKLPG